MPTITITATTTLRLPTRSATTPAGTTTTSLKPMNEHYLIPLTS